MRWLSTAAQVRELDRRVIVGLGLPGVALMELAADGVFRVVVGRFADLAARGVAVVVGPGNNGGDGWVVARRLHAVGIPVWVWPTGEPAAGTDAAVMAAVARAQGVRQGDLGTPGLWVDAVFGTGLTRDLAPPARDAVARMNGGVVVAVDVPTGLCADTGRVFGDVVRAAVTVTFGRAKVGMWLRAGPAACGEVEVVDIGLGAATPPGDLAAAWVPERDDLPWPARAPTDHKTRSGHLLVVAGSAAMAGAAVLACRGALAAGAGLVTLAAPDGARLPGVPPEVMIRSTGPGAVSTTLVDAGAFDAVVAGPGLGGGLPLAPAVRDGLARWWRELDAPALFDADALAATEPVARRDRVLTPHPGEASRLLGRSVAAVNDDRLGAAAALAARGVAVLKGPATVVASDGPPSLNPTGNAVLATGGSGDVLAGVIGALLARGLPADRAARTGVWAHGRAGDLLAAERAEGWVASDIAAAIPRAATELRR